MPDAMKTVLAALDAGLLDTYPAADPATPATTIDYWSANRSGTYVSYSVTFKDGSTASGSYRTS